LGAQDRDAQAVVRPRHLDARVCRGGNQRDTGQRCRRGKIAAKSGRHWQRRRTLVRRRRGQGSYRAAQAALIAVDLIEAAKAGDEARFQTEDDKWSRNVDEIATFLSSANPNWPKNDVLDLLNLHLTLTKGEVVARLQQEWEKDVEAFDEIFTEILTVADTLSEGIIKQFPERYAH
jgi:hypothetical protein